MKRDYFLRVLMVMFLLLSSSWSKAQDCQTNLIALSNRYDALNLELKQYEQEIENVFAETEFRPRGGGLTDQLNFIKNRIASLEGARDSELARNETLNFSFNQARNQLSDLEDEFSALQADYNNLGLANEQLSAEVTLLNGQLSQAQNKIGELTAIVNCISDFQKKRQRLAQTVRAELERANKAYEFYLRNKDNSDQEKRDSALVQARYAWDIYNQTKHCAEAECFGNPQRYCDDYKLGLSHLYRAQMVANNDANVINELGGTVNEIINKANQILLSELGAVLDEGLYNERSDVKRMINRLDELILSERKGKGRDSTAIVSSETYGKFREIGEAFDKNNYAKSVSLYSKYYRIRKLKEFKINDKVLIKADFAAGAILLWDLGNISTSSGFAKDGSWLQLTLEEREANGRRLLLNVARNKKAPMELRKRAYVLLRKQFHRVAGN